MDLQQTKIEELCKDEEFIKHLLSLESAEEMSKELEKYDVDLSANELREMYTLMKKKQEGELSDEELQGVAGGLATELAILIFGTIAAVVGMTGSIGGSIMANNKEKTGSCFKS